MKVGNFVDYKGHFLAVVAISEKNQMAYCLCRENEQMAKIPLDAEVTIVKEKGCQALVKAIYDDMDYCRRFI